MMKRWFGDFEPIKNKFINFKDSVIQWFSDIGTAIAFVPKLIYELFKLAFEGIWNLTSWLWEGIGNAFCFRSCCDRLCYRRSDYAVC